MRATRKRAPSTTPTMTRRKTLIAPLFRVKANNKQTMVEANKKPVRTKKKKMKMMRR
jgi:hypothetical protein